MSDQKFDDTHNLVAFLEKPTESKGFEEIIDFLNVNPIKYALTVNPTLYCSCIKQFWDTVKAKMVNGEVQLQALVDKKKVIITESTIRKDLQLEDVEATECLPTATIFEELTRMGRKQRKDTEVSQPSGPIEPMADETENVECVPTHSNDPLLSGEDSLKLNELMELCTNLQKMVLDLETSKTIQALEIMMKASLELVVNAATPNNNNCYKNIADEVKITLAQTLIEIKSAKCKAKGIVMQEPSESTPTISSQQPSPK
ncbi:hypothetical protein Tco_0257570 [Tanacetum coccineum]